MWPDFAKFHHFGNIFKVYLVLGKVFNSLWHNLYAIGHIFLLKMAKYWKHNLVIWSHLEEDVLFHMKSSNWSKWEKGLFRVAQIWNGQKQKKFQMVSLSRFDGVRVAKLMMEEGSSWCFSAHKTFACSWEQFPRDISFCDFVKLRFLWIQFWTKVSNLYFQ